MEPLIYLAFRFHGNFYHSYRGDTPDEQGFGKDIRIVRHIIQSLDAFNAAGVPVRGTWDFENYFSLEQIMPKHCPELIQALQRRVRDGMDEIELMSWNNGIISAHTEAEFNAAIGRAITNDQGSGVADLFDHWAPIVRPQEMMFTPAHLRLYRKHGITALSLYYSALPFNGFSTFIPPLPVSHRYNPLTLAYPGIAETMTVLPAYNTGDIVDHVSLRRWLKLLRRQQMPQSAGRTAPERRARRDGQSDMDRRRRTRPDACNDIDPLRRTRPDDREAGDMLVLIDMDADDEFWVSLAGPMVARLVPSFGGITGLVNSVKDLPWLRFTTPGAYLSTHPPVATITFGQDTADGSFDGISSWAEKFSSQELWTLLEQSRLYAMQAEGCGSRRAADGSAGMGTQPEIIAPLEPNASAGPDPSLGPDASPVPADQTVYNRTSPTNHVDALLRQSFELRLQALSTTHFGMAAPVMNVTRLRTGRDLLTRSRDAALSALKTQVGSPRSEPANGSRRTQLMFDYSRSPVGVKPLAEGLADTAEHNILVRIGAQPIGGGGGGAETGSRSNTAKANDQPKRGPETEPKTQPADEVVLTGTVHVTDDDGQSVVQALYLPDGHNRGPHLVFPHRITTSREWTVDWDERLFRPAGNSISEISSGKIVDVGAWTLQLNNASAITAVRFRGAELRPADPDAHLLSTAVRYAGRLHAVDRWSVKQAVRTEDGSLLFAAFEGATPFFQVRREITVCATLPYLYVYTKVRYAKTPHRGYDKGRALRLEQSWDERWQEIMPCEIRAGIVGSCNGTDENKLQIWKHNHLGHVSSFVPDYRQWSSNTQLDSVNNQMTNGWVAVSNGTQGLLLAQNVEVAASMAFCPVRTRRISTAAPNSAPGTTTATDSGTEPHKQHLQIHVNPFGTYSGRQYRYPTADTGLGRFVSVNLFATDHVRSYAPSYNGVTQEFELMMAPFSGSEPPVTIQRDAMMFAYGPGKKD